MTEHPTIATFGTADGQLTLDGMTLQRLAARVGTTPFFAYDRALLTARVERLRAALPKAIHLSYAVKANPMPAVVQHLAGLVDAMDVASTGEMATVLDTVLPAERVSFAGPGKTEAEIEKAVAEVMDLTPRGIRTHLGLNRPIYQRTSAYGHFGRAPDNEGGFSWEKTDLVDAIRGLA